MPRLVVPWLLGHGATAGNSSNPYNNNRDPMKKSKPAVKAPTPKPGAAKTDSANRARTPAPRKEDQSSVDEKLFHECVGIYFTRCKGTPIKPSRHDSKMEIINRAPFLVLANAEQEIAAFLVDRTGNVVQFEWEDFEEAREDE